MEINRRRFIRGLAAAGIVNFPRAIAHAGGRRQHYIATAHDKISSQYTLTCFDTKLKIVWDCLLPGRAHDIVVSPNTHQGIVIARRPGLFAIVFDVSNGDVVATITPAVGRHFYGHGAYSRDGRILYMTENAFDEGIGVIGVYDTENGYMRIGEFNSGGVGPHEIALLHDGYTLAIANGGIRTHPDTGREKLNLEIMAASLAFIGSRDGRVFKSVSIAGKERRMLSIRHMAVSNNEIVVGCQDQSALSEHPLVYRCDAAGQNALVALDMPENIKLQFKGYCGSVAYDKCSNTVAVTSPRGGIIGIWNAADQYAWLGDAYLPDGCGIDRDTVNGGFVLSSGEGVLSVISSDGTSRALERFPFRQWDNHLTSV